MIERLLAAENALDRGDIDTAGLLFTQVAQADPRNAIAIVGLARVALREDRIADARDLAEEALAIDPQEAAALRILREVLAETPAPEAAPVSAPVPAPEGLPEPSPARAPERRPSLLARLLRRLFGSRG